LDDEDYDLDLVASLNSAFIDDYDNNLLHDDVDLLLEKNEMLKNFFWRISLMKMFWMIQVLVLVAAVISVVGEVKEGFLNDHRMQDDYDDESLPL
jgi:hypothetical protein